MNEFDPVSGDATFDGTVEPRAKWPSVLGWFSVILGALGIVKNGCTAVMNLGFGGKNPFGFGQTPEQQAAIEKVMSGMGGLIAAVGVLGVISMGVSALLLYAGVQMLRHQPGTVGMHRGWSAARIVIGLIECALALYSQSAGMKAAVEAMPRRSGGPTPEQMATCMNFFTICGGLFGVVIVLAYPVAVLIVLSRPWAKREVARWRDGADTAGGLGGAA